MGDGLEGSERDWKQTVVCHHKLCFTKEESTKQERATKRNKKREKIKYYYVNKAHRQPMKGDKFIGSTKLVGPRSLFSGLSTHNSVPYNKCRNLARTRGRSTSA